MEMEGEGCWEVVRSKREGSRTEVSGRAALACAQPVPKLQPGQDERAELAGPAKVEPSSGQQLTIERASAHACFPVLPKVILSRTNQTRGRAHSRTSAASIRSPSLPGSAASNADQIQSQDTSNARASVDIVDIVESSALLSESNSERQYFGYQERGEGQTGPELLADLLGRRATVAIDNARPVRRSASLSAAQFANPSPTPRI
ncbi:NADH-ubiquinone oxidoreductase, NDUFS3/30 kDa subunit [Moesziomyces antarcticus T-34]|uniref:NADH-ubiquinone oxidoreductase, NDUFS3/30 kDa subunit n=1 Tax=Pseudozyma antarctica (strain T-34) TaxID=1151754 RepID=M9MAT2_PSEA3|nr:NADH-ubiquinone oxidoreductase, NDUFS3/30 kDa subunit [Moesziomyces antarcticus T-34]